MSKFLKPQVITARGGSQIQVQLLIQSFIYYYAPLSRVKLFERVLSLVFKFFKGTDL